MRDFLRAYLLAAHLLWGALLVRHATSSRLVPSLLSALRARLLPPPPSPPLHRVPEGELLALTENALVKAGCSTRSAAAVASCLVASQRDGRVAHGLGRLPAILSSLRRKTVNGDALPSVSSPARAQLRVDADGGLVHGALALGLPALAQRAHECGVATLSVVNARGIVGSLWHHLETLAEEHALISVLRRHQPHRSTSHVTCSLPSHSTARSPLILALLAEQLAWCNSPAFVAPVGGSSRLFGTNPIGFGWPRPGARPLVIDFACSAIARGDIQQRARRGEPIPPGCVRFLILTSSRSALCPFAHCPKPGVFILEWR